MFVMGNILPTSPLGGEGGHVSADATWGGNKKEKREKRKKVN
jgi:hypothetical protein